MQWWQTLPFKQACECEAIGKAETPRYRTRRADCSLGKDYGFDNGPRKQRHARVYASNECK